MALQRGSSTYKRNHDVARVALFEHVRVAMPDLAQDPLLHELGPGLVGVGLEEERRHRRTFHLLEYLLPVRPLHQADAELADVARDQGLAGEDAPVRHHTVMIDVDAALEIPQVVRRRCGR